MVMDAAPQVECINSVRVKELGSKYKDKIEKLKQELAASGDIQEI